MIIMVEINLINKLKDSKLYFIILNNQYQIYLTKFKIKS